MFSRDSSLSRACVGNSVQKESLAFIAAEPPETFTEEQNKTKQTLELLWLIQFKFGSATRKCSRRRKIQRRSLKRRFTLCRIGDEAGRVLENHLERFSLNSCCGRRKHQHVLAAVMIAPSRRSASTAVTWCLFSMSQGPFNKGLFFKHLCQKRHTIITKGWIYAVPFWGTQSASHVGAIIRSHSANNGASLRVHRQT